MSVLDQIKSKTNVRSMVLGMDNEEDRIRNNLSQNYEKAVKMLEEIEEDRQEQVSKLDITVAEKKALRREIMEIADKEMDDLENLYKQHCVAKPTQKKPEELPPMSDVNNKADFYKSISAGQQRQQQAAQQPKQQVGGQAGSAI